MVERMVKSKNGKTTYVRSVGPNLVGDRVERWQAIDEGSPPNFDESSLPEDEGIYSRSRPDIAESEKHSNTFTTFIVETARAIEEAEDRKMHIEDLKDEI